MMKSLIMLAAVIAVASALPRLQFGRLIGGPYYEGENMTITCEDQPSSVGDLNSFSLYRIKGQEREPGTLIYKHYGVIGDPNPREIWSPQIDTRRYSVDQKTMRAGGAKFRIIIRSLDCNDGGQYRCSAEGSTSPQSSTPQNLTISAAPKNLRFAQYTNCRDEYSDRPEDNIDCGRSNCQAMARYGEVPSYTCSVSVPPANYQQYSITWYKRIPNFEDESLIRNVTPSTIDTRRNYRECESMHISSTILYAIQANDHNLVIECRLTGPRGQTSQFGDNSVMNASVTVCVTGLAMPTLRPQECTDRSFGLNCAQTCNCRDAAEACNTHTGACSSVCAAGFMGEECKLACSNGRYGMDCSESCDTCAGHSAGGQKCNYVTGRCHFGCMPGYMGSLCNLACSNGHYGMNCSESCDTCAGHSARGQKCNYVTGRCHFGCMPGYMGSLCNLVCDSGRYGLKCSKICNEKCISDENGLSPCHHVTGRCIYGCQGEYTASVDSICALGVGHNVDIELIAVALISIIINVFRY